ANEGDREPSRQKRILTISFLAASPTWITEDVYIRRPISQAIITNAIPIMFAGVVVVFGARFGPDDISLGVHQRHIPRGRHADGLRKNCRVAVPCNPVQTFA